jgi:hypothetical protein
MLWAMGHVSCVCVVCHVSCVKPHCYIRVSPP